MLLLTARDRWSDKVAGIDARRRRLCRQAFHMERSWRASSLVRRAADRASNEMTVGDVVLDTRSGRVTIAGAPVKLTSTNMSPARLSDAASGAEVVSRTELVEHLYDPEFRSDSNTIEVFVGRLRKLGDRVIETVRGLGYVFTDGTRAVARTSLLPAGGAVDTLSLAVAGFVLIAVYRDFVERSFDDRLTVHAKTLVGALTTPRPMPAAVSAFPTVISARRDSSYRSRVNCGWCAGLATNASSSPRRR